ncbi:hypothetical protein BUALT_Bualt16G0110400 [Buddleja alternifolia]|uniref:BZIP domain-containing protein n=1 Tax=Buddleja alternifolia TaxID=168488 RepID=A0AAV6WLD1_9LAMI|nr:hypothetical protein BUALT_Bualt16G0110400 [Buddleja alternifolia]
MADATVVSAEPPPPPSTADYDFGLSIPPLDTAFFSQQLDNDGAPSDDRNGVVFDDIDFDFSFDDLCLPSADELDDLLNPNVDQFDAFFNSTSSELGHVSGDVEFSGEHRFNGFTVMNSTSPVLESNKYSDCIDAPSPESNGSNRGTPENCGGYGEGLNCASPESQVSGNCKSDVSEDSNNCAVRSVSYSPNPSNCSITTGGVKENTKLEELAKNNVKSSLLKRKKDCEDLLNHNIESMTNKCRKSNFNEENSNNIGELSEEEKKKARLIRNRESAQLSRQRKKYYVEELEDKVKTMHSTIQDLNAKISYFMAENATLRQQMGGGAVPPPGMYPPAAMMYPWMPYAPPYMVKPHGSQVPLMPIPRLKPQQPTQAPKVSKKKEGPKTKKVAGVSFIGVLLFIMFFGGLVPMVNVRYGGVREALTGGETYVKGGFYESHRGRVLMLNGTDYSEKYSSRSDFIGNSHVHCGQRGHDEIVQLCNGSEPLVASLYVPRNDKLVKIDGNLIIHSVLASEKAMSSHGKGAEETGLAVPGDLAPAIPVHRHSHLRALGSGSADKDGRLQQWFREGLAGPILSSGMCTEVFQFDVSSASAPAAIFPATTSKNISEDQNKNSTHLTKGRNRRILRGIPIPLPESSHNIPREHIGINSQKENLKSNNSLSPMVVSVLVDPREAGDADVDGVMGKKSISRIFVVVLIDSVKYVTYSCMLPFLGSAPHLVTT